MSFIHLNDELCADSSSCNMQRDVNLFMYIEHVHLLLLLPLLLLLMLLTFMHAQVLLSF